MHDLSRRVPRLQMLAIFECAASNRSFTAAANELGMTQSGVSRQISALERSLGQLLFHRSANRVVLNNAGTNLLSAVSEGFDLVNNGLERIESRRETFVLAANPNFAQTWMVPYLESLEKAVGDAKVQQRFIDRDSELATGDFDAAIHLTGAEGLPASSKPLFGETTVPVASPDYAAKHRLNADTEPASLADVELLHLDGRERQWMSWEVWFSENGLTWSDTNTKLWYNNHALVMNQVLAGRGVALGWIGLVDAAIDAGHLVEVGPRVTATGSHHYLIPGLGITSEVLHSIEDWIHGLRNSVGCSH